MSDTPTIEAVLQGLTASFHARLPGSQDINQNEADYAPERQQVGLSPAELDELARQATRPDPHGLFRQHCRDLYGMWVTLATSTFLSHPVTCADKRLIEGIRLLHAAMVGDSPQYWISRLAHVQLHHYLKSLEPTIKEDRHRKRINAKQGSKTAGSEIDLYQNCVAHWGVDREKAQTLRRIARRWSILTQDSPLLLLVYSEKVDKMARDFSFTLDTLALLAKRVAQSMHVDMLNAAADLARLVQQATQEQYSPAQMEEAFALFRSRH